jgi:hypothetical protein
MIFDSNALQSSEASVNERLPLQSSTHFKTMACRNLVSFFEESIFLLSDSDAISLPFSKKTKMFFNAGAQNMALVKPVVDDSQKFSG